MNRQPMQPKSVKEVAVSSKSEMAKKGDCKVMITNNYYQIKRKNELANASNSKS